MVVTVTVAFCAVAPEIVTEERDAAGCRAGCARGDGGDSAGEIDRARKAIRGRDSNGGRVAGGGAGLKIDVPLFVRAKLGAGAAVTVTVFVPIALL